MKQLITLTKLELLNLFGINVLRHVKDPAEKKKKLAISLTLVFVVLVLGAYLTFSAYGMAVLGLGDKIPEIYSLLACMLIFVFGLFKAKSYLYRDRDLNLLASLPLKSLPIVASRLIRAYVENLVLGLVILLPTFLVYGIYCKAGMSFYLCMALSLLFLPILPTALAAWFGIAVAALVARNRHKVLTETIFALVIVLAAFLLPAVFAKTNVGGQPMRVDLFSANASADEMTKELSAQVVKAFAEMESSVPLLKTWGSLFPGDNVAGLFILGLGCIAFLFLTAVVIGHSFFAISAKLFPMSVHHDFQIKAMHSQSLLTTLIQKEAKRYFSSGVYVSNTIIGPVLSVVVSIALIFVDPATLLASAGNMPATLNADALIPFLLGMCFCMGTISASSLSMEGKNLWILQSLPVSAKDVMQAKLLFNLIFAAPFYGVSQLVLLFAVRASLLERLWLLVVPAVIILFTVTFGLFCNLKFPKFQWETEVEVVKQSAACGLSILSFIAAIIPGILVAVIPAEFGSFVTLFFVLLILFITYLLYRGVLRAKF